MVKEFHMLVVQATHPQQYLNLKILVGSEHTIRIIYLKEFMTYTIIVVMQRLIFPTALTVP